MNLNFFSRIRAAVSPFRSRGLAPSASAEPLSASEPIPAALSVVRPPAVGLPVPTPSTKNTPLASVFVRGSDGVPRGTHGLSAAELSDLFKKQIRADFDATGAAFDPIAFHAYEQSRMSGVSAASLNSMALSIPMIADEIKHRCAVAARPVPAPGATPSLPAPSAKSSPADNAVDDSGVPQKTETDPTPADLIESLLDLLERLKQTLLPDEVPADADEGEAQARSALLAGQNSKALAFVSKRIFSVGAVVKAKQAGLTPGAAAQLRHNVVEALALDSRRTQARERLFSKLNDSRVALASNYCPPAHSPAVATLPPPVDRQKANDRFRSQLAELDKQINAAAANHLIPQSLLSARRRLNQEWIEFNRNN